MTGVLISGEEWRAQREGHKVRHREKTASSQPGEAWALRRPRPHPHQTLRFSDFQNCGTTNFCCFKSPSLCYFVTNPRLQSSTSALSPDHGLLPRFQGAVPAWSSWTGKRGWVFPTMLCSRWGPAQIPSRKLSSVVGWRMTLQHKGECMARTRER